MGELFKASSNPINGTSDVGRKARSRESIEHSEIVVSEKIVELRNFSSSRNKFKSHVEQSEAQDLDQERMVEQFKASSNQIFDELADWNRILQDTDLSNSEPNDGPNFDLKP